MTRLRRGPQASTSSNGSGFDLGHSNAGKSRRFFQPRVVHGPAAEHSCRHSSQQAMLSVVRHCHKTIDTEAPQALAPSFPACRSTALCGRFLREKCSNAANQYAARYDLEIDFLIPSLL